MRHWKQVLAACMLLILCASCNKFQDLWDILRDPKNSPHFRLKEICSGPITMRLHYNKLWLLDSITETHPNATGSYKIYRTGKRLDSVYHYYAGRLQKKATGFHYNQKGQIIRYTYQNVFPAIPYPPEVWDIRYDAKGNFHTMLTESPHNVRQADTLVYDNKGNMTEYINGWDTYSRFVYSYRYDDKPNPIAMIDDAYFIFLKNFPKDQLFSRSNSTEAKSVFSPEPILYTNEYDQHNRLIKKTSNEFHRSVWTFTYY